MVELDLYSQEDLKKFLVTWFGPQANNWEMNDRLANLTLEIVHKTGVCSDIFSMLPQPYNPFAANPLKAKEGSMLKRYLRV